MTSFVGHLYGWRCNYFDLHSQTIVSPVQKYQWKKGPNEAYCPDHRGKLSSMEWFNMPNWDPTAHGNAPSESCQCGFYAFKDLQSFLERNDYRDDTTGRVRLYTLVKMWGRIVEHQHGYRALIMQNDTIFLPTDHLQRSEQIAEIAGVVVESTESMSTYDSMLPSPTEIPDEEM